MKTDDQHKCLGMSSLLLLSLVFTAVALTSCDGEEPLCVGYFITVGSRDPHEPNVPNDEKIFFITRVMNDSIRAVYPKPNQVGDDKAVLNACANVYRYYRTEHPEYFAGGYTVARLHRGWMRDGVIKSSSVIAMWNF